MFRLYAHPEAWPLLVMVVVAAGCDKAQLLAPTSATISVSASVRVLPTGGSTEVTAFVLEQGGTPVHNGTTVRFTTTLGRVDPVETQTRNGIALTTFFAGDTSGVAEIRAVSGAAGPATSSGTGTGTGTTTTATNVVQITIGAAAVNTVTLRANPGSIGPGGGSVELLATVVAENGRALEGIAVTFNTDQGTLSAIVATTNSSGEARTTLTTNQQAVVSATAGAKTSSNLTITVAAVGTVTVRANPGNIGPGGGSVELIATVVADNGRALAGVPVTFNVDQGSLSAVVVTTNSSGEARTTLTTSQQTVVSATAGSKTSGNVTVTVRSGPIISVACAPASGSGTCAAIQASTTGNTSTVVFTITKPTGSSTLRTATINFGDDTSQSLGNLASGTATVTHTYNGPSGDTPRAYTVTVQATDINNESGSASTVVTVTPRARATLTVTLTATTSTAVAGVGQQVTFEATVTPATGGADMVTEYDWTFGDGITAKTNGNKTTHVYTSNGRKTATVDVTTIDGRTAVARVEFIVSGI